MCIDYNAYRKVIHIDMDAFYASVEERDRPEIRGLPVAIGRSYNQRGVLATANYVARKFGLRSAMSSAQAFKLCPQLILIEPNFEKYKEISKGLQDIFYRYSDKVEPIALDESYIELSKKQSATQTAKAIKEAIFREHQLTASAGVSVNKLIAKIASDYQKPNGLYVVEPHQVQDFIATIPVKRINGVGPKLLQKIEKLGVGTSCGDLQSISLLDMIKEFGLFGEKLYYFVRGIDNSEVKSQRVVKSISNETTFLEDITDKNYLLTHIEMLLKEVVERAINKKLSWKTITLKIKFFNFKTITRSHSFNQHINDYYVCYAQFEKILKAETINKPIRLVGVGVSNFEDEEASKDFFR